MHITFDPTKRAWTLEHRDLDFLDAALVLQGTTATARDERRDYGEVRLITYGYLRGRMVVIGHVWRGESCHVFTMRKANAREETRIAPILRLQYGSS